MLLAACSHAEENIGGPVDPALQAAMEVEGDELAVLEPDPQKRAAREARDSEKAQLWADREARTDELIRNPPYLSADRLPEGTKIGRCVFVVDGQTRISGACSYSISEEGDLHIDGPRQVFDGIDYPHGGDAAHTISTDWWANVFKEDGVWTGYGNNHVSQTNGQGSYWGELKQDGECFVSAYPWGKHKPGDYDPDDHPYDPRLQQNVQICLLRE